VTRAVGRRSRQSRSSSRGRPALRCAPRPDAPPDVTRADAPDPGRDCPLPPASCGPRDRSRGHADAGHAHALRPRPRGGRQELRGAAGPLALSGRAGGAGGGRAPPVGLWSARAAHEKGSKVESPGFRAPGGRGVGVRNRTKGLQGLGVGTIQVDEFGTGQASAAARARRSAGAGADTSLSSCARRPERPGARGPGQTARCGLHCTGGAARSHAQSYARSFERLIHRASAVEVTARRRALPSRRPAPRRGVR
jgi:hypothetical protein